MTRAQRTLAAAHAAAHRVPADQRADYRRLVDDFGSMLMRLGLAGALAGLRRQGGRAATRTLLGYLADGDLAVDLAAEGDTLRYMRATRECARTIATLRVAVHAVFGDA